MKFTILKKITGSGAPAPKSKFAFLARLREIEFFPPTDSLGVVLLGDIKLKENCGMMQLYITPSSQEYGYEVSGDSDSKGHKVKFNGTHPGTEQQALEFVTNYLEEEFVILIPDCDKGIRVLGSPDAPLIFTSSHKSSKDSQKFNFIFEQEVATDFIYRLYDGIITLNENIDIDMSDFLEALKNYIKIDGSNLSDAQKQNLRQILGLDNNAGNIGNQDLQLNENRSFNLKSFFLNFFSNSGTAKVGINKNNPETALDVVGGITTDDLKLKKNGNLVSVAIVDAGENPETYSKSQILEVIDSDFVGVVYPTDPTPTIEGSYEPALSSEDGKDINPDDYGTIYPNIQNFKSKAGYRTRFVLKNGVWSKSEVKMPTVQVDQVFNPDSPDTAAQKAIAEWVEETTTPVELFEQNSSIPAESYTVGDELIDVEQTLSFLDGYDDINQGGDDVSYAPGYFRTKNIYVGLAPKLKFSGSIGGGNGIVGFNSLGAPVWLGNANALGVVSDAQTLDKVVDIPNGVVYLRMSTRTDAVNKISLFLPKPKLISHEELFNMAKEGDVEILEGINGLRELFIQNSSIPAEEYAPGDELVEAQQNITFQDGYDDINQGGDDVSYAPGYFRTKNIYVGLAPKLRFSGSIGGGNGIVGFNGLNKPVWLGNANALGVVSDAQTLDKVVDIPNGVVYLRMSTRTDAVNKISLFLPKPKLISHEELYNLAKNIDVELKKEKFFKTEKIKFARIDLVGDLPTDETNARTPTSLTFEFSTSGQKLFGGDCELSIQGHASATYPKKGYTFDLFNKNGDSLKVKFGDMVEADSFHLKAYYTDRTHTRDVGMGRIWRDMISLNPYPISKVNNTPLNITQTEKDALFYSDAKYRPEGFPVEVYLGGIFLGLYTLRNKKTAANYALNTKNKKHIFLDSYTYGAYLRSGFDYTKWELKSPKINGYVEGGVISELGVLADIERFFNWLKDFHNNIGTARGDYAQYIVLENWIDYMLHLEIFDHWDTNGNNENIITWDGLKWSFVPYDMDNTIGLNAPSGYSLTETKTFFVGSDIWPVFRSVFASQIKSRYTFLRKNGYLQTSNLEKYFDDISKEIPRSVQSADKEKWSNVWTNGYPTVEHIKLFLHNRLNWLDTQWLNP